MPADGSRIEDAFSLYLSYDGAGGRVQGQSVRASSTNVDQVGAYAIASPSNLLYVLLFNKDTVARTVAVSVAGGVNGAFGLYRFTATTPARERGRDDAGGRRPEPDAAGAVGDARRRGPRRSDPAQPDARSTRLTPCRAFDTRNPAGEFGGPALAAQAERTFALAGRCGIPASARPLSLNVTVTGATAAGNVVLFPGGTFPRPPRR